MNKPIRIGGIDINALDMDENITKVVDKINNLHDSGELKSILVVYTTSDSVGASIMGDFIHRPMLCLVAEHLSEAVVNQVGGHLFGHDDGGGDD